MNDPDTGAVRPWTRDDMATGAERERFPRQASHAVDRDGPIRRVGSAGRESDRDAIRPRGDFRAGAPAIF